MATKNLLPLFCWHLSSFCESFRSFIMKILFAVHLIIFCLLDFNVAIIPQSFPFSMALPTYLRRMPTKVVTLNDNPSLLTFFSMDEKDEGIAYATKKNFHILSSGMLNFVKNMREMLRLKQLEKKGIANLSYSEYKFLKLCKEDFGKSFRLLMSLPFSPQYFFYSYLIMPLMSYNNPWAWQSFPSTFDTEKDFMIREEAMLQRKFNALISGLSLVYQETQADKPKHIVSSRKSQIHILNEALKLNSKSLDSANLREFSECINSLLPFFKVPKLSSRVISSLELANQTNTNSIAPNQKANRFFMKAKQSELELAGVPWITIRECSRAIGIEGFPNIPIVRGFNLGGIKSYFQSLRESDKFLLMRGVSSLTVSEVCIKHIYYFSLINVL